VPRIAIIGAGSLTFSQTLITDILSFPELADSTFELMDIDEQRLRKAEALTAALIEAHDLPATVEATTDRRGALEDADYVVCAIHVGGTEPFRNEIYIPREYGVSQSVGDTLGPGGVFRALRTIPTMVELARDMEDCCPEAPLLQHTNPMAMVCWALEAVTSIDTYGICHSIQETAEDLAAYVEVPREELEYRVAGINHMSWFLDLEHHNEDLYPALHAAMDNEDIYRQDVVRFDVMDHFGAFPTESSHHLSEYLPYFRTSQSDIDRLVETSAYDPDPDEFEYSPVCWMPTGEYLKRWSERDPAQEFDPEEIDLTLERSDEYASRIVHSLETGQPRRMNLNVPNQNRVIPNLPAEALVEVPCLVDGTGVQPCVVGALPPQLAALNRTNINVQELAVRAAIDRDETALRQAIKLDPLTAATCSLADIDAIIDDLLEANDQYLPELH
jgi:alpha-galactosidase